MSHLQQRLALFKIQPFRLYALSCVIAMLGNGLSYIAMSWMVLQLDHRITSVVIVMFCFWLPTVIIGPFAGAITDRSCRKTLYVWVNLARGGILIGFGLLESWHQSLFALYALSLLQGIVFTMVLPVVMALIREIIRNESKLLMANATIDIAYEVGNVAGMACAGFAIALMSIAGTLILDGMLFVIAGLLAIKMQLTRANAGANAAGISVRGILADMRAGFRYVMANGSLRIIYTLQLLVMVAFMTVPILAAPFATNVLKANVTQFGVIEASLSIGVILGGVFVPWLAEKVGLIRLIVCMLIILSIAFSVFGYNRTIVIADGLNLLIGMALSVWPLIMTQAQELTDLAYQGRVQSTFNCLSGVLILILYCMVNVGSHWVTLPHLYWIEVFFSVLGVILLVSNWRLFDKR